MAGAKLAKRVIISDMDNTLCDSCREIDIGMAKEIERIVRKGYTFAVIAGSSPFHIYNQVCKHLNARMYALGNSGTSAYFWSTKKFKKLFSDDLPIESRQKIKNALEQLCREFALIPLASKEDQIQDRGTQITFSVLGRNAPSKLKEEYDPDKEKRKSFIEYLKPKISEFEIRIGGTSSLDITKKGRDKGWAVKEFCSRYGFRTEECLFFGDSLFPGGNDYSIIGIIDYVHTKNPQETLNEFKKL